MTDSQPKSWFRNLAGWFAGLATAILTGVGVAYFGGWITGERTSIHAELEVFPLGLDVASAQCDYDRVWEPSLSGLSLTNSSKSTLSNVSISLEYIIGINSDAKSISETCDGKKICYFGESGLDNPRPWTECRLLAGGAPPPPGRLSWTGSAVPALAFEAGAPPGCGHPPSVPRTPARTRC